MTATRQKLVDRIEHLEKIGTVLWLRLKEEHDTVILLTYMVPIASARSQHESNNPDCQTCAYLKQTGNLT